MIVFHTNEFEQSEKPNIGLKTINYIIRKVIGT